MRHSPLGPSTWNRFVRCPGSVQAQAGRPDPARYEAAEGTAFHIMVTMALELGIDPFELCDGTDMCIVDGFEVPWDREMAESAEAGLDFIYSVLAEDDGWRLFVEREVDISRWTREGEIGNADVILINIEKRKIIVWDWKYGKGVPVYAIGDYQTQGYCLGAWATFAGELFDWNAEHIEVTLCIEQPRIAGAGGWWKTTMARVLEFGEYAHRQAVRAEMDEPPLVPGEKQCRDCRARDFCAAFANWHMQIIGLDFEDLDGEQPPSLDPPEEVTAERRSMLLIMRPLLNRWLDALHTAAYHDADMGDAVPRLKLVSGRRPARVFQENEIHKVERILLDELGDGAHHPPKLLSPAQAESEMGKQHFSDRLSKFVNRGEGKPILVPEEDRRPALQPVVDMLDDLDPIDIL